MKKENMSIEKAIKENKKAEEYQNKAEYWKTQTSKIDLSMPESLDYYKFKLEKATKYHQDMKDGIIPKPHSYALTYAKKDCNE